jgi:hypothetical protein
VSLYPLPPLLLFNDFGGNWDSYREALYQIFLDTINNKLTFLGLPVRCRYFQPISDMHRSFWHLITEGPVIDEERIPNFRRCERISWIPHLVTNSADQAILCWENKRGANNNTVLWLPPEKYMIILSKRKEYYLLTTAYVHDDRKGSTNRKEANVCNDPRNS